jgi:anti-sigma factor RsiW
MPPVIPPRDDVPEAERQIIRYVLGQLESPELDEVEDRLVADEAFFEQVEAVEAEVCDDYVAGRLSAAERSAFDARLPADSRLQRRVAFARALAASAPRGTRVATWWWAVAAALIVAAAGAMWFARDRTAPPPVTASGPTPAAAPSQSPSTPAPAAGQPRVTPVPPVIATITLFGPVVRDAAQVPVLTIPAGQGMVRVEVALQDGDVFPVYRAEITTQSGGPVFSADRLPPSTSASGRTVVTDVPADRLGNGTYQITVYGVRADLASRLVTYPFRVTR